MQPRLVGLGGPAMGLIVNLSPSETTLGREVGNTIVLNSSSVSRRHARIVPLADGFAVEDLGSSNGVRVNGMPISVQTALKNGDRIDLGEVSFLYESPQAASPNPYAAAAPKKPEVGSQERAAQFAMPSQSDASGCNPLGSLLNDLSGLLPGIMKYGIFVLLGLLVLFCLFSLLMMGVSAISSLMHHDGGSQPPAGQSQPQGRNGQKTPPPSSSGQSDQQGGSAKIYVLSTRVIRAAGANQQTVPTLLVKWRNDSDQPVSELDGDVTVHLPDGSKQTYPKLKLYSGTPVQPGQLHEDTGSGDGTPIATDADPNPEVLPTEVK